MFKNQVIERITKEFGSPARETVKVTAWDVGEDLGVVVQTDQPNKENQAFVWLPYPPDSESLPEIALEYAAESGRHSNTYPSPGLERGRPALKLIVTSDEELDDLISYIKAFKTFGPLPEFKAIPSPEESTEPVSEDSLIRVDIAAMPKPKPKKPRREAIPRAVQREVWQRDGGQCVECNSKAKLCFDHIVPFSKGGSNTVRNLQLLCERCNLSKGNRI
ncbi:Stress protein (modular protein) [Desulfamplus magnetovallimortis]|uniref:Stress protein (Modular protein) n=1 Tax=Desulfamplus magnetovallimortis TaxID=1246637 RepID=A0A1W1H7N0_9BACT|nr:HNH endonuclease [Desulfamplus magnetovallimortis]SLM28482.1 Stress protein (modular protein) [Desulfamplus magnetovallimortis]